MVGKLLVDLEPIIKEQQPKEGNNMAKVKIEGIEIGKNISPNGEYFRVKAHLKAVAKAYREAKDCNNKYLLAGELESYGATMFNNGNGRFILVF